MEELVFVKNNEVYVDSRVIADHFTKGNHYHVKKSVETLMKDLELLSTPRNLGLKEYPIINKTEEIYRKRKAEYYELNRFAFSMLATRFRTKEAIEWTVKFLERFFLMEKALARQEDTEWITSRQQSKIARREETDMIKKFVEYAKNQGSKNADMYYIHITKATNKTLQLLQCNEPSTRDFLDKLEISQLIYSEMVVKTSLEKYMEMNIPYKEIFKLVKEDLLKCADLISIKGVKQLKVGK